MSTNDVLGVANVFIQLAAQEGRPLTNMMLQKLLYLAQGHSLGLRGHSLVDERPQAWDYGPVFPSVYRTFREYGGVSIEAPGLWYDWSSNQHFAPPTVTDPDDLDFIRAVWDTYKHRDAIDLSNMSHVKDGPWDRVYGQYRNAELRDEDMREYFAPSR